MVVLAVLFGPAVLGGVLGYVAVGWLGALVGAPIGFVIGLTALAGVLTPWVTRAVLAQHGLRMRGSRWRGGLEVWDLRAREVTVVRGLLRPRATVRRLDRRDVPPDPPRDPPAIPGLWPVPPEQSDVPQLQRALARARRYRSTAVSVVDERPRRGR
ncbi:MAG: hypothetical protein ACJ74O_03705 [Frankiaceae bacterium]